MKLVTDWQSSWKWNSMQVYALLALIPPVWMEMPDEIKALLPVEYRPWVFTVLAIAGVAARLRDQGKKGAEEDQGSV